jgi:hypothetical protein
MGGVSASGNSDFGSADAFPIMAGDSLALTQTMNSSDGSLNDNSALTRIDLVRMTPGIRPEFAPSRRSVIAFPSKLAQKPWNSALYLRNG